MCSSNTSSKHYTDVAPEWYDLIQEGMRRVVNESGGTARQARIPGITVCGKTGTAENPHGQDHAVFICFAPMEDPQDRHRRVRGEQRFRWHLGRTDRQPPDRAVPHRYHYPTQMVEKMLEADLIAKEATYVPKPKKPRSRR